MQVKKAGNVKKQNSSLYKFDAEFLTQDITLIAGVDEAGRGPLAGPVCVASVIMPLDKQSIIKGVDDSKKLSPLKREKLYQQIIDCAIDYHIEFISEGKIDEINILNATKLGMENCLKKLKVRPHLALLDAVKVNSHLPTKSFVKGDMKSYSIACASILAKVARDKRMQQLSEKYPNYNFGKHKGYPTREHIAKLKEFGACAVHRQSFLKNFTKEVG